MALASIDKNEVDNSRQAGNKKKSSTFVLLAVSWWSIQLSPDTHTHTSGRWRRRLSARIGIMASCDNRKLEQNLKLFWNSFQHFFFRITIDFRYNLNKCEFFCIFFLSFLKKKKTLLRQYSLGGHLRGPLHFLPFFLLFFLCFTFLRPCSRRKTEIWIYSNKKFYVHLNFYFKQIWF